MRLKKTDQTPTILNLPSIFLFFSLLFLYSSSSPSPSSSSPYSLIWYPDLIERTEILKSMPHLFRVHDIYELYPWLTRLTCGDKPCKSPYIEMTNFTQSDEYIRSLPTVLIVAGTHGNEVVGTNAIYRLLDMIPKYFDSDVTWFRILNQLRVIFLPLLNPTGFFNKRREESQMIDGKQVLLDPNRDFNWDNNVGCFKTLTSQMVNHVYKDNLIVGTLTFHGGDNSLTYPWGTFVHLKKSESNDQSAFEKVVNMLKLSAGENPKLNVLEYNTGTMENVVYDVHGGYEDWAYGASFEIQNLSKTCLKADSQFSMEFLEADDNSNRAFVFLVEAGKDKTPKNDTLGNELSVVDKSDPDAEVGNISRNMTLIKQFFEIMRPFVKLSEIKIISQNLEKVDFKITLDVRGCDQVDSIKIMSPPVLDQNFEVGEQLFDKNTQSNPVILKASVDISKGEWSGPTNIQLQFTCDSHWLPNPDLHKMPQSHFFKAKTDSKYKITRKGFTYGAINLDIVRIENIDLKMLEQSKVFYRAFNHIELATDVGLGIQFKDRMPLEFRYDHSTRSVSLKIIEDQKEFFNFSNPKTKEEHKSKLQSILEMVKNKNQNFVISVSQIYNYPEIKTDPLLVLEKFRVNTKDIGKKTQKKFKQILLDFSSNQKFTMSFSEFKSLAGKKIVFEIPKKSSFILEGLLVDRLNLIDAHSSATLNISLHHSNPGNMKYQDSDKKVDSKQVMLIILMLISLSLGLYLCFFYWRKYKNRNSEIKYSTTY